MLVRDINSRKKSFLDIKSVCHAALRNMRWSLIDMKLLVFGSGKKLVIKVLIKSYNTTG